MSAATSLDAVSLPRSVNVVITPTSEAVIVASVGLIAVFDKSDASATAAALIVGYTGTEICFPCPVIL